MERGTPMSNSEARKAQQSAEDNAASLARVIAGVTDLWDEPLDDVYDIPQIANAILAAGWTHAGVDQ